MKRFLPILLIGFLTACTSAKTPGLSKDPAGMSADTLCFRYMSSKDPALAAEIAARDLDCTAILRDDPLLAPGREDLDRAHRL